MIGTNNKHSKIRDDIKTLKRDLYTIKDDLESISSNVLDESKETINEVKQQATKRVAVGMKRARDHVRERPLSTTLMAAGAGFLAATLLSRR
ncbi:MAG: YqjD family protein [Phycisphaeraceae bacterium JB051]